MVQTETIRDKWLRQIAVLRDEIASMPEGAPREAAQRRIKQLENAAQMESLMSPLRKGQA